MKRILSIILTVLCLAAIPEVHSVAAQKQRTTRKNLSVGKNAVTGRKTSPGDTLTVTSGLITVSGYEKPLRSNRESAMFTNNSDRTVCGLMLDISYSDMKGRELHRRNVKLECDIPPRATRQIYWPSWDRQFTFYYHRSPKPRRGLATPYSVKCDVDTILTHRK